MTVLLWFVKALLVCCVGRLPRRRPQPSDFRPRCERCGCPAPFDRIYCDRCRAPAIDDELARRYRAAYAEPDPELDCWLEERA